LAPFDPGFVEPTGANDVHGVIGLPELIVAVDGVGHLVRSIFDRSAASIALDRSRPAHVPQLAFLDLSKGEHAHGAEILVEELLVYCRG
jgi:hypothetical protein